MPTSTPHGDIESLNLIPADEGALKQIYGRIGNFKSYYATVLAFELLARGQVVKTNWKLFDDKANGKLYSGYDERNVWWKRMLGALRLKKRFLEFPANNWELFGILPEWAQRHGYPNFLEWFANQTDCTVMIDEGHIVYDSYQLTRMSMEDRVKITSTRHFDRSVYIISQRPSAIHVNYRANVNQFFKCEDLGGGWFGRSYRVTEFQDTTGDGVPDETREEIYDEETHEVTEWKYKFAVSEDVRTVSKRMYNRYDSKYLREGMPASQLNHAKRWRRGKGGLWMLNMPHVEETVLPEAKVVVVDANEEENDG